MPRGSPGRVRSTPVAITRLTDGDPGWHRGDHYDCRHSGGSGSGRRRCGRSCTGGYDHQPVRRPDRCATGDLPLMRGQHLHSQRTRATSPRSARTGDDGSVRRYDRTTSTGSRSTSPGNLFTANFDANTVTRIRPDGTTSQFGGTTGNNPTESLSTGLAMCTRRTSGTTVTQDQRRRHQHDQFGGTTGPSSKRSRSTPTGTSTPPVVPRTRSPRSAPTAPAPSSSAEPLETPLRDRHRCDGNVYTSNYNDQTVTRISADGTRTTQFGGSTGSGPSGIAIDAGATSSPTTARTRSPDQRRRYRHRTVPATPPAGTVRNRYRLP